jgi:hypothetical protein
MPPSVCCANKEEQHSAAAANMASSRGSREGKLRNEDVTWIGLRNWDFPEKPLGIRKDQKIGAWTASALVLVLSWSILTTKCRQDID